MYTAITENTVLDTLNLILADIDGLESELNSLMYPES